MFTVTIPPKTAVVLIVEDDREMRSLLCDEFWSAGYRLQEAKDGEEALEAVLQSEPDLILTDLRMRGGGAEYIGRLHTTAPRCPLRDLPARDPSGRAATEIPWTRQSRPF